MRVETLANGISCIHLSGMLDIVRVNEIQLKFTVAAETPRKSVIVDLSEVAMVSSMGIRMLISAAKTLKLYQSIIVLLRPNEMVHKTLSLAAITDFMPVEQDIESALARIEKHTHQAGIQP